MNTKSWLAIAVLLTLSSMPSSAYSQEVRRERLEKGSKAPFAGNLLSDAALAKLTTEYERQIKTLKLDLEKAKRELQAQAKTSEAVCKAKVEGEAAKHAACLRDLDRQRSVYDKAINRFTQKEPWYKSPYLHFILGGVVTGAVCVGASRVN